MAPGRRSYQNVGQYASGGEQNLFEESDFSGKGAGSSGSAIGGQVNHQRRHSRSSGTMSVGAWIKSRGADWWLRPQTAVVAPEHPHNVQKKAFHHGTAKVRRHHHHRRHVDHSSVGISLDGMQNPIAQQPVRNHRRTVQKAKGINVEEAPRTLDRHVPRVGIDKVVVMCFVWTNCIIGMVALCVAVISGLLLWYPRAFRPLLAAEARSIFADFKNWPCTTRGFDISPSILFPGVFEAVLGTSAVLFVVTICGVFLPLLGRHHRTRLRRLNIALHFFYMGGVIAIAVVIGAYLAYYFNNTEGIQTKLRQAAKTSYVYKYRGMKSCDSVSNFVNFVQRFFRCCGVDAMHDYENMPTRLFETSGSSNGVPQNRTIPITCCRLGTYKLPESVQRSDGVRPTGYLIDLCRQFSSTRYRLGGGSGMTGKRVFSKLPSFISFFLIWNGFAVFVYMFWKHRLKANAITAPGHSESSSSYSEEEDIRPFISSMWRYKPQDTQTIVKRYRIGGLTKKQKPEDQTPCYFCEMNACCCIQLFGVDEDRVRRRRRIDKSQITGPSNFVHLNHMNPFSMSEMQAVELTKIMQSKVGNYVASRVGVGRRHSSSASVASAQASANSSSVVPAATATIQPSEARQRQQSGHQ